MPKLGPFEIDHKSAVIRKKKIGRSSRHSGSKTLDQRWIGFLRRTPVANTDTKLLIYGLFQKGRVLAQDGISVRPFFFLARLQVGFRCFAQAFVERHELRF